MDLDESRRPLDAGAVSAALTSAGWAGPLPVLHGAVTSTAAEALALLAGGAPALTCVVAESVAEAALGAQSPATLPAGSALWLSLVVPGAAPGAEPGWLAPLSALAVVEALRSAASVPAEAAWPDAVTVPGAACGGGSAGVRRTGAVSATCTPDGCVVSVVVNVGVGLLELPPGATSVFADGGRIDRTAILAALLPALARRAADWRDGSEPARRDYRGRCQTLGRLVRVGGAEGQVVALDEQARLVVDVDGERVTLDDPAALALV